MKDLFYRFIKRTADIFAAVLAFLLFWWVFIVIAVAVKREDGGKVFFAHKRVGLHGKEIYIYKFRTMRENAPPPEMIFTPEQLAVYRTEYKVDDDPRITKTGKFLRKTSLDELPQLWNVLKGDMSLVGPRPLVRSELDEHYGKDAAVLTSVRPGLTGYWQAYARNDVGYADGKRRQMELWYVTNRSLWTDIKIFGKTIGRVLSGKGAK